MTDRVLIGRIVKAHGIRGEVAVDVLSDVPGRLDAGTTVEVDGRPTTVAASRPHQGRLLLRFDGVDDRTAAEGLRGREITAPPLEGEDHDQYFVHELIGLRVRDVAGGDLGEVTALIELPDAAGYDLLEVRRADGATWLLPAVDDYVEVLDDPDDVDAEPSLVVVDPPEGLVDGDPLVAAPDAEVAGDRTGSQDGPDPEVAGDRAGSQDGPDPEVAGDPTAPPDVPDASDAPDVMGEPGGPA